MPDFLILIAGLLILVAGGDILVRGSVSIAERLSIPPLIIGLTIVSLGTSAPELFISVQAALDGSGGLAVGNVIGSNIANVLLVLGLPSLIKNSPCGEKGIERNIMVMGAITIIFMALMVKGSLGFSDGLILLILLTLFLWDQYVATKKARPSEQPDYHDDVPELPKNLLVSIALLIGGIILLPLGGWLTVSSAQDIARSIGVSDEIIGLTIVAIGTSLPELAASMMAVLRGSSTVAIGNVVGSNIFNIAAIMGITTVIAPVEVSSHLIHIDMWVMLAVTVWLGLIAYYKKEINKPTGVAMMSAYIIYIGAAFLK
ncbi:MAG: calcium/sodium antiporter [Pseudomonadota bacterium]